MRPVTTKIAPEYRRMLAELIRRAEERGVKVGDDSGFGKVGVWRFKAGEGKDAPTVSAAERMARYLETLEAVRLPPPTVSVIDARHYEWAQLGEWMLRHEPDEFSVLLERVKRIVRGRQEAEELEKKR